MAVVSFTPWLLYSQGKIPRYSLDRSWVGPTADLDFVEKRKPFFKNRSPVI
jgi:hypothetical protein